MKKALGCVLLIICSIFFLAIGGYTWYQSAINYTMPDTAVPAEITIETGQGTESIIDMLIDQQLVSSNKLALQFFLRLNPQYTNFKAGDFTLSEPKTTSDLFEFLNESPSKQTYWFTIPEGLRYTKVVEQLKTELEATTVAIDYEQMLAVMDNPEAYYSELDNDTVDFLSEYKPDDKSIEGFLYPDTYNIDAGYDEYAIVDLLVNTLADKIDPLQEDIAASDYSLYEILNMASMLEREANQAKDYRMIADIMQRRLDRGMLLDIDATILYGLDKDGTETIFQSEIDDTSNPYNTRRLPGLPPTPIANPGIETIEAVLNPEPNEYLYYLTGKDGNMYYAKTYSEHVNNNNKYLE